MDQLNDTAKGNLVSWVHEKYDRTKTDKQRIRRQWDYNLQMYSGNQYVEEVTGKTGLSRLSVPDAPSYRMRSTTNRTRPIVLTEITRLTSQKPSITVVPASGEDDDLFAAQAAESVWEYLFEHERVQWKMERVAFWCSVTGNGLMKVFWNKHKRDTVLKNVMGMPTEGNIDFGVVTPYNLFIPDLLVEDIEDQPYVIEAYTKPVEWANRFFGGDFKPNAVAKTEIFESSYFETTGSNSAKPDSVLIIECYLKPGALRLLPEGGCIHVVNDTLVDLVEGMPYGHDEYPYTHVKSRMTGKFYGDSVLNDTNPLQKEYNLTRNQIIENKNRTSRPQLLVPVGSMDPSKYTSEPGKLVMYRPGLGKPEALPGQPLPNYVLEEQGRIIADMEDLSGQHQVSRGMAPGQGVVAATAIAYLQEKDESMLATTQSSLEQGITKIARQSLSLVVEYWEVPRIIKVTGTDRAFDSFELKGADIANSTDVRCEPGSSLPMGKSARQAWLMDLYTSQAISAQQMLDQMQFGGVGSLVDRMRIDMRAAQRENLKMKKLTPEMVDQFNREQYENAMVGGPGSRDPNTGIPVIDPANMTTYPPMVTVHDFDNHAVHIQTHNNYRKSQEFEMLAPPIQDQFAKHIQIHQMYMYMGMADPMMQQSMTGAPPGTMGMAVPDEQMAALQGGGMGGVPAPTGPPGEQPGGMTGEPNQAAQTI